MVTMKQAVVGITLVGGVFASGCGCDDPTVNPFAPTRAALTASPTSGVAPLEVTLDASATVGKGELQYRFDLDGDGTFDTEFSSSASLTSTYETSGSFTPVVEVQDEDGEVVEAAADVVVEVRPALADIDVDVNRDGSVDALDKGGENEFTEERGAIILSNVDDDDRDGERDILDDDVDGSSDYAEMAKVMVQHAPGLEDSDVVTLRIEPAAARDRIRIFQEQGDGAQAIFNPQDAEPVLETSALKENAITLWVEGIGRTTSWDGRIYLKLEVKRSGSVEASDEVLITSAPVIFPDNIQRARELFIMRIPGRQYDSNEIFFNAVQAGMPGDVDLFAVDQYAYGRDRWVQDNMQAGYQEIPVGDDVHRIHNYLEAERWSGGQGLEILLPNELLDADFGFSYPSGDATSLNYGGNLEVAPPHEGYPFGRLLYGGGAGGTILGRSFSDQMNPTQLGWLDAQEVQAPAVQLSSEWLVVGHIDEIFLFVPDHRTVAEGGKEGRPWKVMFASPDLAITKLEEVEAAGFGNTRLFPGRETSRTVTQVLNDDEQVSYNTAVQTRIDSVRLTLMAALNLDDDDVIEVPVMYESDLYQGVDFSVAHNPGIQNLIVADSKEQNGVWFIPDPEGPTVNGVDVWQEMTRDVAAPLGATLNFVDVFESYHLLLGEAHCGSNVRRDAYDAKWWSQP
ncbi:MAG: hypothetical protein GY822_28295 [Deltaproteobacteria bacterium]|nr:hypothetical protein [Deltaproteobacteria bacterium]